uniref:Uncharacterized protein n=1 Tax=Anguilla anguilla TaxID=7936 RepID=A0A0E9UFD9_ANGAN
MKQPIQDKKEQRLKLRTFCHHGLVK